MTYLEAVSLLLACWVTGYVLGWKLKQIQDALSAV